MDNIDNRSNLLCHHFTDEKMTEYPTVEKEVMKILTEVAVARREAEIVSAEAIKFLATGLQIRCLFCFYNTFFFIKKQ